MNEVPLYLCGSVLSFPCSQYRADLLAAKISFKYTHMGNLSFSFRNEANGSNSLRGSRVKYSSR